MFYGHFNKNHTWVSFSGFTEAYNETFINQGMDGSNLYICKWLHAPFAFCYRQRFVQCVCLFDRFSNMWYSVVSQVPSKSCALHRNDYEDKQDGGPSSILQIVIILILQIVIYNSYNFMIYWFNSNICTNPKGCRLQQVYHTFFVFRCSTGP